MLQTKNPNPFNIKYRFGLSFVIIVQQQMDKKVTVWARSQPAQTENPMQWKETPIFMIRRFSTNLFFICLFRVTFHVLGYVPKQFKTQPSSLIPEIPALVLLSLWNCQHLGTAWYSPMARSNTTLGTRGESEWMWYATNHWQMVMLLIECDYSILLMRYTVEARIQKFHDGQNVMKKEPRIVVRMFLTFETNTLHNVVILVSCFTFHKCSLLLDARLWSKENILLWSNIP